MTDVSETLSNDSATYPYAQDLDGMWHRRPPSDPWITAELADDLTPNCRTTCGLAIQSVHVSEYRPEAGERLCSCVTGESLEAAIADWCEEQAKNYPASVFTAEGRTSDGIAGTALREFLTAAAHRLREQPQPPSTRHAINISRTGWFAEFTEEVSTAPWQPSLQSDGCCYSLDVHFDSKGACQAFIRQDVLGCGELT